MGSYFKIEGGQILQGEVSASGSKNAALPILAATVLLQGEITLHNVPAIKDIQDMVEILRLLGAKIYYKSPTVLEINASDLNSCNVDPFLGNKIRGSYYLLGSLMSKYQKSSIPQPGGCDIGVRPMDLHLLALQNFGVKFTQLGDILHGGLENVTSEQIVVIKLPFPSRGATVNSILTSALLDGKETHIINADPSPEVSSLIHFLSLAGLDIKRIDKDIFIKGKKELSLESFKIASDKIEVATFLVAGLMTNGEVNVTNISRESLGQLEIILNQIGARYNLSDRQISVDPNQLSRLRPTNIISGHRAPCVDADNEPIFTALFSLINGSSLVDDTINSGRHANFLPGLMQMGAQIEVISPTRAIIEGSAGFKYTPSLDLVAGDIRGGVSLLLAALTAFGKSILRNVGQIDRGYEKIEEKIRLLGGNIQRIND